MSYQIYRFVGPHPQQQFCIADTQAEVPTSLPEGTLIYAKDTNKLWTASGSSLEWNQGGSASHGNEAHTSTFSTFTQTNHDALANPHHSNANDHVNSEGAHSWHTAHHSNANDHANTLDHSRLHTVTATADHTFPGGTSTFLRADGTFAAPGGGSSPWTLVMKTSDESHNSSATVADDATLRFTPTANTQYHIRLRCFFLTNATADLKYRMVHTGTTTRVRRRVFRTATTDVAQTIELKTAFDAADVILSTTGLNPWLEEDITLQVGATPGEVKLQWGQVTSNAGPTTLLEGSYLEYAAS